MNASYNIEGKKYMLKNGVSETEVAPGSSSKIITRYFGNDSVGDVTNDGLADQAFLISQDTGGSGTFYYLVAALKAGTGYTLTNTIFLGDRIAPLPTNIRDGEVVVNYAERKAGEPLTMPPTIGVTRTFKVVGTMLQEVKN